MSEKENIISPSDEVRIVNAFKYWYETNTEKGVTSIPDYICKGLLDLYNKEKMNSSNLNEQLNKEKEKNKKYENKIKAVLELIDTKPYTAYTLYGDILYDDENIRELLEERR